MDIAPTFDTSNNPNLFQRIHTWNALRDNLTFNHYTATKILSEELFEFCLYGNIEAKAHSVEFAEDYAFRHDNDLIVQEMIEANKGDLVDALGDLIFIAIGDIYKLGFEPEEVLKRICNHNDAKGSKKDADGKILKDADFVEPVHV